MVSRKSIRPLNNFSVGVWLVTFDRLY